MQKILIMSSLSSECIGVTIIFQCERGTKDKSLEFIEQTNQRVDETYKSCFGWKKKAGIYFHRSKCRSQVNIGD